MLRQLMIITGLMLFASTASADVRDKSSSFSAEQDALTGAWTLECNLDVSDIDRLETYSVGINLQFANGSSSVQLFNTTVVISPDQRSVADFADGLYSFEAKKVGKKLSVSLEANWAAAYNNQRFICDVNVAMGISPSSVSMHAVSMTNRITGGAAQP